MEEEKHEEATNFLSDNFNLYKITFNTQQFIVGFFFN